VTAQSDRVETAKCKCCGEKARGYGVVDLNKNCAGPLGKVLQPSGVAVQYYRCPACQFIFTTDFDAFSPEDFARVIYNDEYRLVDPDYAETRPRANAAAAASTFRAAKPRRVLDYGGGSGTFAARLRSFGFPCVDTYDPFVPEFSRKPDGKYDLVTCFEMVEHTTDPVGTFGDMSELLADPGLIVFSTLVQPRDIEAQRLDWWYAAPRNGHVSLYSPLALHNVVKRFGLQFGSINENLHLLFRTLPEFARTALIVT
jgi:2-polyprenyl-6-hydroxyphenyl methylase/3-demethylubiquinone-9 3-methyltransferase